MTTYSGSGENGTESTGAIPALRWQALVDWADSTDDGSRADLPFRPSREVWEEVRSETDACLRAKCPYFQECHYQRARRTAASADVVVVNHARLMRQARDSAVDQEGTTERVRE